MRAERFLMALGAIIGAPLVSLLTALLNGWVLTKLWAWFIVPTFNLPTLTLFPATGLAITVGFLTYSYTGNDKELWDITAIAFVVPLLTLAFAWLIHWMAGL
jgi:hypothetical protein